jgi:hypothetical protein
VLTLTSVLNQITTAPVVVTLDADDQDVNAATSASLTDKKTFLVTVQNINTAPVITALRSQTYLEDAVLQVVDLTITDETPNATLNITAVSSKPSLVAVTVSAGGDGSHPANKHLHVTPVGDANSAALGSAAIIVSVKDDGRDTAGGIAVGAQERSATTSFLVTETAVNDAPTFALAAIPWLGNTIEHVVPNFIQNLSLGGPDEVNQTYAVTVTPNVTVGPSSSTPLFLSGPTVDSKGTLRFTPGTPTFADGNVPVTFSVVLTDSGGTANGGANNSTQTAGVTITRSGFAEFGEYNGLFYDQADVPAAINTAAFAKAGYISMNLLPSGAFTGYILTVGTSNYLSGAFNPAFGTDPDYPLSTPIAIADPPMTINLTFNRTTGEITGNVDNSAVTWGGTLPTVRLIRSVVGGTDYIAAAGNYTMVVQGAANDTTSNLSPAGDGITWVVVDDTGYVSVNGWLGDATPISMETAVSKNSEFPLYVSLYGGKGGVFGWVKFNTSAVIAPNYDPMLITAFPYKLQWEKAAVATDAYYAGGFAAPIKHTALISPFEPWLGWNNLDLVGNFNVSVDLYGTAGIKTGAGRSTKTIWATDLLFDTITTNAWNFHGMSLFYDPANAYLAGNMRVALLGTGDYEPCFGVYLQAQKEVRGFFIGDTTKQTGQLLIGRTWDGAAPITVTPGNQLLSPGPKQFTATAKYADGSTRDITQEVVWSISNAGATSTITVDGLATIAGAPAATSTITATLRGKSGTASVRIQ